MPLTRFAPAPTGLLHIGHVVNAIFVWGLARARGASVLLRIEDHDRERSIPAFEHAILDDLDWLGFAPDRYATDEFRRGFCNSRQSDREAIYRGYVERLASDRRVYGCTCSRQDLAAYRVAAGGDALAYPGTCRTRGISIAEGVAWRVRIEDVAAGPIEELLGEPAGDDSAGDPVIRDRRGNWTYQFAVTVDDLDQGVDLVVRGRDLIGSTGLQVRLAQLLGRTSPPRFAHHPLVMKNATEKLSKSAGDSGVAHLRATGWTAERVIGRAAQLAGLAASDSPLRAVDVGALFRC